ncbi:hypothetical protein HYH03_016564 [Edaphochlamys debaryana]|uniref:Uncharacterized protein n=1 Tax=Edaphochlamys debaryana TaxID=47281 RepID=A0A835XPE3_9CHLO|nr:hypothetical protein HYH03_016564 [Edaphochlamys debaryana]|eukprot:KAG2484610.1 hypothetical protein HYH03_016564 [Edaphochlamys debaryana]
MSTTTASAAATAAPLSQQPLSESPERSMTSVVQNAVEVLSAVGMTLISPLLFLLILVLSMFRSVLDAIRSRQHQC